MKVRLSGGPQTRELEMKHEGERGLIRRTTGAGSKEERGRQLCAVFGRQIDT